MVAVRAWREYLVGIRDSGFVSTVDDVLEMSVVRGVCGVCEMSMCLDRAGLGGV